MKLNKVTLAVLGPFTVYADRVDYTYLEFHEEDGSVLYAPGVSAPHEIDAGLGVGVSGDFLIQEVDAQWRDKEVGIENALVFTCINGVRRDGSTWLRKAQADIIPSGWEMLLNPFGVNLLMTPIVLVFGGWIALPYLYWVWKKSSEKMAQVNHEALAAVEQM